MKAVEVTGTIDEKGQLSLDSPISVEIPSRVRVIVLFSEPTDEVENDIPLPQPLSLSLFDPDDTPIESIKASLRRALQQAKAGQRIPLAQMWDGIDAE